MKSYWILNSYLANLLFDSNVAVQDQGYLSKNLFMMWEDFFFFSIGNCSRHKRVCLMFWFRYRNSSLRTRHMQRTWKWAVRSPKTHFKDHRSVYCQILVKIERCPTSYRMSIMILQISQLQFDRIMSYIESGKSEGAHCLVGGKRLGTEGYFIEPTWVIYI